MAKTICVIKEDVLRNATREQFAKYKKALILCRQLEGHQLVFLESSQKVQSNNNLQSGRDFFQEFLDESKSFQSNWSADNGYWDKQYPQNNPNDSVIVFGAPPEQSLQSPNNIFYQSIDDFSRLVIGSGYRQLRDYLVKSSDKDLANTKKTKDLFKKYALIIDEFLHYEFHLLQSKQWLNGDFSIVDVLFEKKQWSLLVVALSSSQYLSDMRNFKNLYFKVYQAVFSQRSLTTEMQGYVRELNASSSHEDEVLQFFCALKEMLLSPPDFLYPALWDKLCFLSKCHELLLLLPPNDIKQINEYMASLIEAGCKKAAAVKKDGLHAELDFLARVDTLYMGIDLRNNLLVPRIEACLDKLVNLHCKKEQRIREKKEVLGDSETVESAFYEKDWGKVIEHLNTTPVEQWGSLRMFIDDSSMGLELKAFVLRASHFAVTDKNDPSVKTLDDFLANHLLACTSMMNTEDRAQYLQRAIRDSILKFVLGGHPSYDSMKNDRAKNRLLEAMSAADPDQALDALVYQQDPDIAAIIKCLSECNADNFLPCRVSTENIIFQKYKGEKLASFIFEHFVPKTTDAVDSENYAVFAATLKYFLRPDGLLIALLESAAESVRKEYNKWNKLAFLHKMKSREPLDVGNPQVNLCYEAFFKTQLKELNIIIINKCLQYEKHSEGALRLTGGKTDVQMKVELETLYALRTAIIETRIVTIAEGVDEQFVGTLTDKCEAVKKGHPEGFAKHAVSVFASKTETFYNKLLAAAKVCAEKANTNAKLENHEYFSLDDSFL